MTALSDPTTITISVIGLFAFLAIVVLVRSLLGREPSTPSWRRYRLGVFVERDAKDERPKDEPPEEVN